MYGADTGKAGVEIGGGREMRDFWEDVGLPITVIGVLLIGLLALLMVPVGFVTYAACGSQATKMDLQYSWGPLQDCMVNVDGKWMLLDSYKVIRVRP